MNETILTILLIGVGTVVGEVLAYLIRRRRNR